MYKLGTNSVIRVADGASIPADDDAIDFQQYKRWRDGWTERKVIGQLPRPGSPTELEPVYEETVHPPHVPLPADPAPPPTKDELDVAAVRADPKLLAIMNMTPDALRAFVNNPLNFPTLTAGERDKLATLAVGVGILARRI
jgi:hypothetical protein